MIVLYILIHYYLVSQMIFFIKFNMDALLYLKENHHAFILILHLGNQMVILHILHFLRLIINLNFHMNDF